MSPLYGQQYNQLDNQCHSLLSTMVNYALCPVHNMTMDTLFPPPPKHSNCLSRAPYLLPCLHVWSSNLKVTEIE